MTTRTVIYFPNLRGFIDEVEAHPCITDIRLDEYFTDQRTIVAATAISESGQMVDGMWTVSYQAVFVYNNHGNLLNKLRELLEEALPEILIVPGIYDHPHLGDVPVCDRRVYRSLPRKEQK